MAAACEVVLDVAVDDYALEVSESSATWSAGEYVEVRTADLPEWDGPVEFEPADVAQVIPIHGYAVLQDITIDPIPSNYGRITWDGSVLEVS